MLAFVLVVVLMVELVSTTGALTVAVRFPVVTSVMFGTALMADTMDVAREPLEEVAAFSEDSIVVAVTFPEEGGVMVKSAFTDPALSATSMLVAGSFKNVAMAFFKLVLTDAMSEADAASLA